MRLCDAWLPRLNVANAGPIDHERGGEVLEMTLAEFEAEPRPPDGLNASKYPGWHLPTCPRRERLAQQAQLAL